MSTKHINANADAIASVIRTLYFYISQRIWYHQNVSLVTLKVDLNKNQAKSARYFVEKHCIVQDI